MTWLCKNGHLENSEQKTCRECEKLPKCAMKFESGGCDNPVDEEGEICLRCDKLLYDAQMESQTEEIAMRNQIGY